MPTISESLAAIEQGYAHIGAPLSTAGPVDSEAFANLGAASEQVSTFTLSGAFTVGIKFSLSIHDDLLGGSTFTVDYTTDGTEASLDVVAAGLVANFNANARSGRIGDAAAIGTSKLTITGRNTGLAFTVTSGSSNVSAPSVVNASVAAVIPVGRAVVSVASSTRFRSGVGLAVDSLYAAQVDTGVITYQASAIAHWRIAVDDDVYEGQITMATDAATTAGLLETSINAALPANTVVATSPANDLILTAEIAGLPFSTKLWVSNATTGAIVLTSTASELTDALASLTGIAQYNTTIERGLDSSTAVYGSDDSVTVFRRGSIAVDNVQTVKITDPVYLDVAAASAPGKFYNDAGAGRIKLPREKARWIGSNGQIAGLRVSF